MHNSIHWMAPAIIVPLSITLGCTPPKLDAPASLGSEIASRTGATPAWAQGESPLSPDAATLRSAANRALPDPLDERVAVAMALDANPLLARMIAETDALRADAFDIAAPQNPVVNLTSGVPLDSMSVVPIFAMLMVQVDELWKQPIRSEAARDSYEAALLALGARAVALSTETRALWNEVALRETECEYATNDLALTEQLLVITRAQLAAGELTKDELAKLQAEFLDAHHRNESASEMRGSVRLALMALLGRSEASTDWKSGSPDSSAQFALHGSLSSESELLARLASSRLDVRAADARTRAAQSNLVLAQRSRFKSVQIGGGFDRDMEGDEAAAFSANIELPLFNDGSARVDKATAQYHAASIDAEAIRQSAITALRTALVAAAAAQARHDLTQSNLIDPTAQTLARARAAVDVGEGSQQAAIDAAHALNHANLAMTDLERERRTTRIALATAAGFLPAEVLP